MDRLNRGAPTTFSAVLTDDAALLARLLAPPGDGGAGDASAPPPPPPPPRSSKSAAKRAGGGSGGPRQPEPPPVAAALLLRDRNDSGATALHLAAAHGSAGCVRRLLDAAHNEAAPAAVLEARDAESQWSALHRACYSQHWGVALQLLAARAGLDEGAMALRGRSDRSAWRRSLLAAWPAPPPHSLDREGLSPLDLVSRALAPARTQPARAYLSALRSRLRSGGPVVVSAALCSQEGAEGEDGWGGLLRDADAALLASFARADLAGAFGDVASDDDDGDFGFGAADSRSVGSRSSRRSARSSRGSGGGGGGGAGGRQPRHRRRAAAGGGAGSSSSSSRAHTRSHRDPPAGALPLDATAVQRAPPGALPTTASVSAAHSGELAAGPPGATEAATAAAAAAPTAPALITFDFSDTVRAELRAVVPSHEEQLALLLRREGLPLGEGSDPPPGIGGGATLGGASVQYVTRVLTFGRSEMQLGLPGLGHGDHVLLPRPVALPDDAVTVLLPCGDGSAAARPSLQRERQELLDSSVVAVAAGKHHNVALRSTGHVAVWGLAQGGRLGLGSAQKQQLGGVTGATPLSLSTPSLRAADLATASTPVTIPPSLFGGVTIVHVSASLHHTLAVDSAGGLWAWGDSSRGALGIGKVHQSHLLSAGSPSSVAAGAAGRSAPSPSGKRSGGLAATVSEDACVVATPTRVEALRKLTVSAASAGHYHSLAVTSDGGCYGWGSNLMGQTGIRDAPHAAAVSVGGAAARVSDAAKSGGAATGGSGGSGSKEAGWPLDVIAKCTVWLPTRCDPLPPPLAAAQSARASKRAGSSSGSFASDSGGDESASDDEGVGILLPASFGGGSKAKRPSLASYVTCSEGYSLVLSTQHEVFAAGCGGGAVPGAGWHRAHFDATAADDADAVDAYRAAAATLREPAPPAGKGAAASVLSASAVTSTLSVMGFAVAADSAGGGDAAAAAAGAADGSWATTRAGGRFAGGVGASCRALRSATVVRIACAKHHALAVDTNGGLWAWSEAERTALWGSSGGGSGAATAVASAGGRSSWSAPTRVPSLYRAGVRVIRAAAGLHTSFAVSALGDLFATGDTSAVRDGLLGMPASAGGAAGLGASSSQAAPPWARVPTVKAAVDVAAGDHHAAVTVVNAYPALPPLRPTQSDLTALLRVCQAGRAAVASPPASTRLVALDVPSALPAPYRELLAEDLRHAHAVVNGEDRFASLLAGVEQAAAPAPDWEAALARGDTAAARAAVLAGALPPIAPDGRVALVPSLASMCERVLCAAGVTLSSLGAALATCESLPHAPGLGAYCGQVVTLNADIVLALAAAAWQPGAPPGGAAQWDALLSASDGLVHGRHFSRGSLAQLRTSSGAAHLSMVRTYKCMKRAEYCAVRPSGTWRGVTAASQQSRWRAAWAGTAAPSTCVDSAPTSAAGYGLSQGLFDCVNRDAAWVRATLFPDESDPAQALWTEEELLLQVAAARRRRGEGPRQGGPPATPNHQQHHPARRSPDSPQFAASLAQPPPSPQAAASPAGSSHNESLGRALPSAAAPGAAAEAAVGGGGARTSSSSLRARSTSATSIVIDRARALRLQPISFRDAWEAINAVGGGGRPSSSHDEDDQPVSRADDGEVAAWVRAVLPLSLCGSAAIPPALRSSAERLCCNLLELGLGPAAAVVGSSLGVSASAGDLLAICDVAGCAVRALLAHTANRHFGDVGVGVCRDLLSATMADDAAALLKRLKSSRKRLLDMTRDALAAAVSGGGGGSGRFVDALTHDQRSRLGRRGEVLREVWALGRLVPLVDALATHVAEAVAVAGPAGGDEEAYLAALLALAAAAQGARDSLAALLDGGLSPVAVGPLTVDGGLDDVLRGAVVGVALAQAAAATSPAAPPTPSAALAAPPVAAPSPPLAPAPPTPIAARPVGPAAQPPQQSRAVAPPSRVASTAPTIAGPPVAAPAAFPSLAQAHAVTVGGGVAAGTPQRRPDARPVSGGGAPGGSARGIAVTGDAVSTAGRSGGSGGGVHPHQQRLVPPSQRLLAPPSVPAAAAVAASLLPPPSPSSSHAKGLPARSLREVIAGEEAAAAAAAAAAKARAAAAQQAAAASAAAARAAADRESQQLARRFNLPPSRAAAVASLPPSVLATGAFASSGGHAAPPSGGQVPPPRRSLADIMQREHKASAALAAAQRGAASRGAYAAGCGVPRSPASVQHTPWGAPALAASMQQGGGRAGSGGGGGGGGGAQSLADILSSEEAMRLGREETSHGEGAGAAGVTVAGVVAAGQRRDRTEIARVR